MKLWSIPGNSQRLDGGAMFGNAPRAVWAKWLPPDEQNRVPLACRALLASPLNGKTVLFETGIGAFFDPKMRERYGVVEDRHVNIFALEHGELPDPISDASGPKLYTLPMISLAGGASGSFSASTTSITTPEPLNPPSVVKLVPSGNVS